MKLQLYLHIKNKQKFGYELYLCLILHARYYTTELGHGILTGFSEHMTLELKRYTSEPWQTIYSCVRQT